MKPTQKELTNWAITQIQEKYKDDVALLIAIYGHSLENDCHGECFDYFVPVNENGNNLGLDLDLSSEKVNIELQNFSGKKEKNRVKGSMNNGGIPVYMRSSGGNVDVRFDN